jgi:hypothetical protein
MKELLKELRKLDSETFERLDDISISTHGYGILKNPNARIIGHIIQGEIQRAVEAKGYMFSISHIWPKESLPAYRWKARIFVDPDNIAEIREDSPTKAILVAYLAVIRSLPCLS